MANPQLILKDPKVKLALIVVGVALALYLLTGSWLNNINNAQKTVHNNFLSLKQNCEHRLAMIPQFVQLFQTLSPDAHAPVQQLTQTYMLASKFTIDENILTNAELMQAFIQIQRQIGNSFALMAQQTKNYPAIEDNRQYIMLRMQLQSLDQQIQYMSVLLNQSILIHNSLLSGFPKAWLNSFFIGEKPLQLIQASALPNDQAKELK